MLFSRNNMVSSDICMFGEICPEMIGRIAEQILALKEKSTVNFYIDSGGGCSMSSVALTELMKLRRINARAYVLGECSSSALIIFSFCKERYVSPLAFFCFHEGKWESDKNITASEAKTWAAHFDGHEEKLWKLCAERLGEEFVAKCREKGMIYMSAEEMVEQKLAKML